MTRVKSVKLVILVLQATAAIRTILCKIGKINNFSAVGNGSDKGKIGKISNFGATGGGSNNNNLGKIGKINNFGAVGNGSDKGKIGKIDKIDIW